MAIREGAWDCPSCGQKGVPGSSKYCGACGNVRGDDVQFYLPEGAREITSEEERRRAGAGPDWKCPYCGGDNPGSNSHCSGCGSPQDGTEKRQVRTIMDKKPEPPRQDGPNWMSRIATGCCLLILLFFVGCWFLTRTTVSAMQIQSMAWRRSIDIEKLGPVTETGWEGKNEVPAGARILGRNKEVRETRKIQTGTQTRTRTNTERVQTGTEKVKVGTKDMGNGYFEDVFEERPVYQEKQVEETYQEPVYREEPVYDYKVRYEINKWHKDGSANASGSDNKPTWPEIITNSKQRAGPKHESYTITLSAKGKSYTYETNSESMFIGFSPGQTVDASVTVTGVVTELKAK